MFKLNNLDYLISFGIILSFYDFNESPFITILKSLPYIYVISRMFVLRELLNLKEEKRK